MVKVRHDIDLTAFSMSLQPVRDRGAGTPASPIPISERPWWRWTLAIAAIAAGEAAELVWLLEHPPLYTSGTSGKPADLLEARFPLFETGRGGQVTYHGHQPAGGLCDVSDLKRRQPDVQGLCRRAGSNGSSAPSPPSAPRHRRTPRGPRDVGVSGVRPAARQGPGPSRTRSRPSAPTAALGFPSTASRSMSSPTSTHFSARSCPAASSIPAYGVTSLADLGLPVTMMDVDVALRAAFEDVFGGATHPLPENRRPGAASDRRKHRKALASRRRRCEIVSIAGVVVEWPRRFAVARSASAQAQPSRPRLPAAQKHRLDGAVTAVAHL